MAYEREVQDFTAQGTDLPESKLSTGFIAGERPPANWFNSLFSRITQAIKELQTKATEKENVLLKDNTEEFTPTEDYQPATKKYVDDNKITVDSELSDTSENPVQNKVIKQALEDISSTLTFDSALSTSSTNAVQNKVITEELNTKAEVFTFTNSILTTGWVEDTQTWTDGNVITQYYYDMPVIGLLEIDRPHITPVYKGFKIFDEPIQEAWSKIDRAVAGKNNLRVYAFSEIPTTEIPLQIEVVR